MNCPPYPLSRTRRHNVNATGGRLGTSADGVKVGSAVSATGVGNRSDGLGTPGGIKPEGGVKLEGVAGAEGGGTWAALTRGGGGGVPATAGAQQGGLADAAGGAAQVICLVHRNSSTIGNLLFRSDARSSRMEETCLFLVDPMTYCSRLAGQLVLSIFFVVATSIR